MAAKEILVKKYVVRLSDDERERLAALIRKGSNPAHRLLKARILLKADVSEAGDGWSDNQIIDALATSASATLDIAVVGKQGRGAEHRRSRQRQHNRAHSQKNILKPHLKQQWVIPPKANSAFVAAMEDVLAVYTRPRDPNIPLVCLDETSKQLIAETRAPIQRKEGRPARFDYYERNGTVNLFMRFAPLEGWRHVKVTDRHTAVDYAHASKDLAEIHFLNAKKIVLVQDNLNTHTKASLYEAFPAAEARRLAERVEWHYTPKHGSWLDMAESELGVLSSQCLDRRIPDKQTLIDEIAAWEDDRNANHAKADWQFTTADARIKLKHLYPSI